MSTLLHLSDLHLMPEPEEGDDDAPGPARPQYENRVEAMTHAIRWARAKESEPIDAVLLTGDLLDSATVSAEHVGAILEHLTSELRSACGRDVPILIVPGNHDRRRVGLIRSRGPGFGAIRAKTTVPGAKPKAGALPGVFMVTVHDPIAVVTDLPGIDIPIVLNDSSFLDGGLFGAGGTVWAEDVLAAADKIRNGPKGPVIWLLHHHLVPTPVTDLEFAGSGLSVGGTVDWIKRKGLSMLASVVSNIDHEELTMTALGAGTVLSSLHMLERPVLVLHGHKHFPTARVLTATRIDEGDVALVSAGSAGVTELPNSIMSIYPSFNVVRIGRDADSVHVNIEAIAFPPDPAKGTIRERKLVDLRTRGSTWVVHRFAPLPAEVEYHENHARYVLSVNGPTLDLEGHRHLRVTALGRTLDAEDLKEAVDALPGAELIEDGKRKRIHAKTKLEMKFHDGRASAQFTIVRGVARTLEAASQQYGEFTPYEWIGLPNRRAATVALLEVVEDEEGRLRNAFASATDLATGSERPLPLERDGKVLRLCVNQCPPRCLLRIYWRLPSEKDPS